MPLIVYRLTRLLGCFEEEELLCSLAVNKATFAPIRFLTKDELSPYGSDPRLLVDGVKGTSRSDDSRWAKSIEEMEFILELKQQEKIEEISWTALNSQAENMSVPSRKETGGYSYEGSNSLY